MRHNKWEYVYTLPTYIIKSRLFIKGIWCGGTVVYTHRAAKLKHLGTETLSFMSFQILVHDLNWLTIFGHNIRLSVGGSLYTYLFDVSATLAFKWSVMLMRGDGE